MKQKVYIETSVISYFTGRPSSDWLVAAHQDLTRIWWESRAALFSNVVSELVLEEAERGDPIAAEERLAVLREMEILEVDLAADALASHLIAQGTVPKEAAADALHIAIASVNGIDYLLTWNCKHIANAFRRKQIEVAIEEMGYTSPILCTPEELMED